MKSIHDPSSSPAQLELRVATPADTGPMAALIYTILQDLGLSPTQENIAADLAVVTAVAPAEGHGAWVLVDVSAGIVGTVALRRVDADTVELQKMYLDPRWRGLGQGRRLLHHGLAMAKSLGYRRVVLDPSERMITALRLYRANGFTPIDRRDPWSHCDLAFTRELGDL